MHSLWELANSQLRDLAVYQPGKPIEETARELNCDPSAIIKLASSENPLGPSPKAVDAIRRALNNTQLYPEVVGFYLPDAIAAHLGFVRAIIILVIGSNDIIEVLDHAILTPVGDVII